ncbi:MAG: hypothetical protein KC684_08325 [Candidatus Omnitrophica bacterium]|nr:hypothetical protein [Candidatus Omnitrophota bacterium]
MEKLEPLKLTLEDGRRALGVHVLEKGYKLREKYGKFIDYDTLLRILQDEEFVRYPTKIVFDSAKIEEGMFGYAERISTDANDGYIIYIHEEFKKRSGDLPALVFYHLVTVNYGEFATYNEAEEFASAALGMEKDYYYQYICRLTDSIPGKESRL